MKKKELWMFRTMNYWIMMFRNIKVAENGIPAHLIPVPPVGDL